MSQQQVKAYTHSITQEGNYVITSRKGHDTVFTNPWPIGGYNKDQVVDCLVYTDMSSSGISYLLSRNDTDDAQNDIVIRKFLGIVGSDFQISTYGVPIWINSTSYVLDDITWNDQKIWKSNTTATVGNPPSPNNPDWFEIESSNATSLDTLDDDLRNTYYYRSVYTPAQGNIQVVKTADHEFEIRWLASSQVIYYVAKDYNGDVVSEGQVQGNVVLFTPTVDGAYYVELTLDWGAVHYAEVYDFTDTERCYLELMKGILCECLDCKDCPDSGYTRALNYASTYILLRDVIYVDQSAMIGLTSTTILRTGFISIMGKLIAKLLILSDECLCSDNDDITVK